MDIVEILVDICGYCGDISRYLWIFKDVCRNFVDIFRYELGAPPRAEARHADGIVLVGGCALNILANTYVQRACSKIHSCGGVYVPAAPSDCGLSVGAAWHVVPRLPDAPRRGLQYAGVPLFDIEDLPQYVLDLQGPAAQDACGYL